MTEPIKIENVQDRLDCLQELTEFTEKCRKRLNDIFDTLGWSWTYEDANKEPLEQCPYDPNHRVPPRSLEKHKLSCRLRKLGYSPEEQTEMVDTSSCYQQSTVRSFTMERSTQQQVILQARSAAPMMKMEGVFWQGQYSSQPVEVPQNHKRTVCDLTVADRLALYDHVIGALNPRSEAPESSGQDDLYVDWVSKLQRGEEQNEPKTHLELMAEMRDYKRRRQSYRAKNVHITKKSYTEVIREVINVHSEELGRQWREEEEEEEKVEEETRLKVSSHRRRSSSSESGHSHSRRHHSRERSHGRESKKRRKERNSRSPEDCRHDRKKKKKKSRKEDKDKEK